MKRVLSKNSNPKANNEPRQYTYADTDDSKARHILGLDITHLRPSRRNSLSSSSTNKLRSVTFSNATTAAVTVTDSSQSEIEAPSSSGHKDFAPLLRRKKKGDIQIATLKPKLSSSSLRSFYDKSRTPLIVSQQTSDSSSRDFALRKGAPLVVSTSTQETEHSRQIRLMSGSVKNSPRDRSKLAPSTTRLSNDSSRSLVLSLVETTSDTAESFSSQPSASRISILRSMTPRTSEPLPTPNKVDHPFPHVKPVVDPARAKINVRRPKVGTTNWFDNLDTDSSDDEGTQKEPQLADNIALEIPSASHTGQNFHTDRCNTHIHSNYAESDTSKLSRHKPSQRQKTSAFENVDLTKQSILHLESSDDEEEIEASQNATEANIRGDGASSVMSGPWDNTQIEVSHTRPISTKDSEKVLQQLQQERLVRPPVPKRSNNRPITYLDDCSTETVTQQDDLLTSFPRTPTDNPSRGSSLRDYILSEDEASFSTKLMTVTRQEESLIAAMRLKKIAMKKAQAAALRQGTLTTLERNDASSPGHFTRPRRTDSLSNMSKPYSPVKQPRIRPPVPSIQHSQRTDSVTTFQTDSIRQPSVRSSIATYLSEGSEDLQLSYSTIDGLPIGSSRLNQSLSAQPDRRNGNRDTVLSGMSTSTYAPSTSEWSPSVRDSHVVELDPLDHQILREEIPSQLFMERPFIGWEARASMQKAH